MASVWTEKRGKRWLVRWREADGRVRSKSCASKAEQQLFTVSVKKSLLDSTYTSKERRSEPFVDYIENVYAGDLSLRDRTREHVEESLRLHLRPRLGALAVGDLSAPVMRRLFAELHAESPWIAQMAHRVVCRGVRQARAEGLLTHDPLSGVKVSRPERRPPTILTPAEVQAIADAIEPRYRLAVLLAAWGGLRIGEIGAVDRGDIDLERGTVTIRRAVSTPHGQVEIGPPKTAASRRTVTLPGWLLPELASHLLRWAPPITQGPKQSVFATHSGAVVTHMSIHKPLRAAAKAAGIAPFRFHDLRHTAIAILIAQGAHPKAIQARVGHSSITMTMDVYGHLFPSTDAELAASLEKFKPQEAEVIELARPDVGE